MKAVKAILILAFLFVQGCGAVDFLAPEPRPYNKEIVNVYLNTELKQTPAIDVFYMDRYEDAELLSQSKKAIAITGSSKDGYKAWFNLVGFDEDQLTATRKYLFIVDEKHKILLADPRTGAAFYSEQVIDDEVMNEPFASDNVFKIEVLRAALEDFKEDTENIVEDNETFERLALLLNQSLEQVLHQLDESPAKAARLTQELGMEFQHINLDEGKIKIKMEGNILSVKMMLGTYKKYFNRYIEEQKGWEYELF